MAEHLESGPGIRGGCLCGAVRFVLTPPTDFAAHCHCASCRRSHGAAFVTWTGVPDGRFAFIEGEDRVRWYDSSEWIRWGFCETCGSSMLYTVKAEGHPESPTIGRVYVAVGSLVDPLDREPSLHVSYDERVSWFHAHDRLPRYRGKTDERMPDGD